MTVIFIRRGKSGPETGMQREDDQVRVEAETQQRCNKPSNARDGQQPPKAGRGGGTLP